MITLIHYGTTSMSKDHAMRTITCLSAAMLILGACTQPNPTAKTPSQPAAAADQKPAAVEQTSSPQVLPDQPSYATPDDAVAALSQAAAKKDLQGMARILGLPAQDAQTDSAATDAQLADRFAASFDEFHRLVVNPQDPSRARLFIGKDNYPVASPLVRVNDKWFFDSAGGKKALIARAIGENELNTIGVCRAYVQAQYEYYAEDRNGDDVLQYAQLLASTKGNRDGLYWKTEKDQPESPLGPLIAEAKAEGDIRGSARSLNVPKPYHGYLFRILTAQGQHAAGGAYSYVINGRMVAGFALLAYPAKYGKSGVVTFEVAANGKVYQKDLGATTSEIAGAIKEYDPDGTWMLAQE
jgi:hypothetical protein